MRKGIQATERVTERSNARRLGWAGISLLKLVAFCVFAAALVSAALAREPARDNAGKKAGGKVSYGLASYYGKGLQGKQTADGDTFDKNDISAAHPSYPMGTHLRVTNLANGRAIKVRINDRGPTEKHRAKGVIIDLSERAAIELGFKHDGKTRVKTEVLEWGEGPVKTAAP